VVREGKCRMVQFKSVDAPSARIFRGSIETTEQRWGDRGGLTDQVPGGGIVASQ
jgi:hypothetical protein